MKRLNYFQNGLIKKLIIIFAFGCFFFGLPKEVSAAEFYFSRSVEAIVMASDIFVVDLMLSSPEERVNVLEGYLSFDKDKLEIKEMSAGGSLFELWLEPPNFYNETGEAHFIGGVANGFLGTEAKILKIIFQAKKEGQAFINLKDDSVLFLNDGKGTRTSFSARPIYLEIKAKPRDILPRDEWRALISEDHTPPEAFAVIRGRHPSIFENRYFISFFTSDKQSGIDFYEVKEGGGPFEKAVSPYPLKDQSLRGKVEARAWDKAGNYRTVKLSPEFLPGISFFLPLIFISFFVGLASVILLGLFIRLALKIFLNKNSNAKK